MAQHRQKTEDPWEIGGAFAHFLCVALSVGLAFGVLLHWHGDPNSTLWFFLSLGTLAFVASSYRIGMTVREAIAKHESQEGDGASPEFLARECLPGAKSSQLSLPDLRR